MNEFPNDAVEAVARNLENAPMNFSKAYSAQGWLRVLTDTKRILGKMDDAGPGPVLRVADRASCRAGVPGDTRMSDRARPSVVSYGDTCVELHLGSGAVAQLNVLPDGDGFGIRVWQPYGTYSQTTPEQQENDGLGHNLSNLSAAITFDADGAPRRPT